MLCVHGRGGGGAEKDKNKYYSTERQCEHVGHSLEERSKYKAKKHCELVFLRLSADSHTIGFLCNWAVGGGMAANVRAADASLRHLLGEDVKQQPSSVGVAGQEDASETDTSVVADDVTDMDDPFAGAFDDSTRALLRWRSLWWSERNLFWPVCTAPHGTEGAALAVWWTHWLVARGHAARGGGICSRVAPFSCEHRSSSSSQI